MKNCTKPFDRAWEGQARTKRLYNLLEAAFLSSSRHLGALFPVELELVSKSTCWVV